MPAFAQHTGSSTNSNATILLALGCGYIDAQLSAGVTRIEALTSPDYGTTWQHAGTLLTPADMEALGFPAVGGVDAADLVLGVQGPDAGRIFLSATPGEVWGYAGCLIFELQPVFSRGKFAVLRENQSNYASPVAVMQYLSPGAAQFSGACTAAPPALPWMLPMLFAPQPSPFRILQSTVPVPPRAAAPL